MTFGQDFDQTYSSYKDANSFQPGRCNIFVYLETPVLNPIIGFLHLYPLLTLCQVLKFKRGIDST